MKSDPTKCWTSVVMCALAWMMLLSVMDKFASSIDATKKQLLLAVLNAVQGTEPMKILDRKGSYYKSPKKSNYLLMLMLL